MHIGTRRHLFADNELVISLPGYVIYFREDPLLTNYLDKKVPIDIVIDYIEERPYLLRYESDYTRISIIIQQLRSLYPDPTELYKD